MKALKQWILSPVYAVLLAGGFLLYLVRGKTPALAYNSMVHLFCNTMGYSNDVLSRLIGFFDRPYRLPNADGVLGQMSNERQLDRVITDLRERGYHVFEQRLPDEICDRLLQYATSHPCEMLPMDGQHTSGPLRVVYDRDNPRAVRYDFSTQDLLSNPDVQALLADLSFTAVAQRYLGAKPVIDVLTMWWLTFFSDKPDAKAAQYFHFDMDRPKWLKFFIYVTDVHPTSGPHTFVAGSHRSGRIPQQLLQKGYARLTDAEVAKHFPPSDIREFSAPRGTILAEDTRGLHKGKHVESGDRLILQIQYSNSLFGGDYPKAALGPVLIDALRDRTRSLRKLYSAYM